MIANRNVGRITTMTNGYREQGGVATPGQLNEFLEHSAPARSRMPHSRRSIGSSASRRSRRRTRPTPASSPRRSRLVAVTTTAPSSPPRSLVWTSSARSARATSSANRRSRKRRRSMVTGSRRISTPGSPAPRSRARGSRRPVSRTSASTAGRIRTNSARWQSFAGALARAAVSLT